MFSNCYRTMLPIIWSSHQDCPTHLPRDRMTHRHRPETACDSCKTSLDFCQHSLVCRTAKKKFQCCSVSRWMFICLQTPYAFRPCWHEDIPRNLITENNFFYVTWNFHSLCKYFLLPTCRTIVQSFKYCNCLPGYWISVNM